MTGFDYIYKCKLTPDKEEGRQWTACRMVRQQGYDNCTIEFESDGKMIAARRCHIQRR